MALKAIISKDEHGKLADALKGEYADSGDGNFRLSVEAVNGWALEDVAGLRRTVETTRKERDDAKVASKKFVDADGNPLDPEKVTEALSFYARMKDAKPDEKIAAQHVAREQELIKKHTQEIKERDAQIAALDGEVGSYVVDVEVANIMRENGGGSAGLLLGETRRFIKVERDATGKRVPRIYDENGVKRITRVPGSREDMSLKEFVLSTKKDSEHPDWARCWDGSGHSGSGAGGNNGMRTGPGSVSNRDLASKGANLEAIAAGKVTVE
jgi:hypothetical protein